MGAALASMKPAERAETEAALAADPALVTGRGISKELTDRGYRVASTTVRRHRNGECRCNG